MLMKLRENVTCLKGSLCTLQRLVQKAPHQHVTSFVRVLSLKEEDLQSERSHYAVILLQLSQSQNLATFCFFCATVAHNDSRQVSKQSSSQHVKL